MDTAVVECRYRDKVIGHLVVGPDGWLKYVKKTPKRRIVRNTTYQTEYPST